MRIHRPSIQTIQLSPKEHFPSTVGCREMSLNIFDDGRAYAEGEHRTWLTALRFAAIARVPLPQGVRIITTRKAV